jgi:hypothetical protein
VHIWGQISQVHLGVWTGGGSTGEIPRRRGQMWRVDQELRAAIPSDWVWRSWWCWTLLSYTSFSLVDQMQVGCKKEKKKCGTVIFPFWGDRPIRGAHTQVWSYSQSVTVKGCPIDRELLAYLAGRWYCLNEPRVPGNVGVPGHLAACRGTEPLRMQGNAWALQLACTLMLAELTEKRKSEKKNRSRKVKW